MRRVGAGLWAKLVIVLRLAVIIHFYGLYNKYYFFVFLTSSFLVQV